MNDSDLNDQLDDIAILLKKGTRIAFWAFWLILFLALSVISVGALLESLDISL